MQQWLMIVGLYLAPVMLGMGFYWFRRRQQYRRSLDTYRESLASGLKEPPSLHPVIDPAKCLGCATCVSACPEKSVLGLIDNRAQLISPASCIGHGACKTACPTQAIELVFGTATRGVDIPLTGGDFQTNVAGIYIAGELGGMGLIRNAIEQGRQAVECIAGNGRCGQSGQFDLLIIGAGPAGISAAMSALESGLSYKVLEQDTVGGTIAHYPRGKVVMTAPATLPLVGEFQLGETSKEDLMQFWSDIVQRAGLDISCGERAETIKESGIGFEIQASECFKASNILLAIGRRGTPRKLDVTGEHHSKVVYRLVDPEQYRGKKVVVVGGGDSAIEAAVSLSLEPGTDVTLCYRGAAFNRVKQKNRDQLTEALASNTLIAEMESRLLEISPDTVQLETTRGTLALDNDAVIVCAGGILATGFLKSVGIHVETRYGTAR
jgi:thioredoxin reductase (NADPH)